MSIVLIRLAVIQAIPLSLKFHAFLQPLAIATASVSRGQKAGFSAQNA